MASSQDRLIEGVIADLTELAAKNGREPPSRRLIAALRQVPRAEFVPPEIVDLAHLDRALPIGFEQTISQPFIVGLMTDLLQLGSNDRVLEIGTGSGYQAAVLAQLAREVFSIERVVPLADEARERLRRLGYRNVQVRAGDGQRGWPETAPFDAIVVTAAAPEIPPELLRQLAPGGRLVLPLERTYDEQELTLVRKDQRGDTTTKAVLPVRFVPLLSGERRA